MPPISATPSGMICRRAPPGSAHRLRPRLDLAQHQMSTPTSPRRSRSSSWRVFGDGRAARAHYRLVRPAADHGRGHGPRRRLSTSSTSRSGGVKTSRRTRAFRSRRRPASCWICCSIGRSASAPTAEQVEQAQLGACAGRRRLSRGLLLDHQPGDRPASDGHWVRVEWPEMDCAIAVDPGHGPRVDRRAVRRQAGRADRGRPRGGQSHALERPRVSRRCSRSWAATSRAKSRKRC